MSRETENRGNTRALSEYFSPRSKVKNLTLQGRALPHFTSFLQETPMKPSQVPNRLPDPPPRRVLPFQSPELCHRDRLGPPQHLPQHLGSNYSSGFVQISPANIGSSADRHHSMPRDRPGPLHHSAQPPGSFFARLAPVSPTNNGTSANKPQPSPPSILPASIPFMRDLSNQASSSHIRRGQVTKSKAASSYSGSKNVTTQRQESNKAQSSDVRSSIHTVKLPRPPVTSSFNTTAAQEGCPLLHSDSLRGLHPSPSTQSSDRSGCSSLPTLKPVAPCQDQQYKRMCSSEKSISAITIHSSQKRRRDCEDYDDGAKKLCLLSPNSGKPNVGNSLNTSSSGLSSVMELSLKTTDSHLCTEPACGQSNHLELSSTFKPTQSSCTSLSPKPSIKRPPSMGAKQAYLSFSQNHTLKLTDLRSSPKLGEGNLMKRSEENYKRHKSSTLLSSHIPQKDTGKSPCFRLRSHHSRHTHHSTSVLPAKTVNRDNQVEERRKLDSSTTKPASKPNSEQNKTARPRRAVTIPDDIADLFTPDPMTYVVNPAHKTAKPKTNGGIIKSTLEESFSSGSSSTVSGSPCCKTRNSLPSVALQRVKLEHLSSFCPKESELKNKPVTSSGMQVKLESVKSEMKHTSVKSNMRPSSSNTDTASSEQTSKSYCPQSPLREVSGGGRKQVNEEDLSDVELDLGLSFALDLDLTQSSHSSEEEQLLSLQEMMECVTKPPDTPEKGAFSEPSTPGRSSCQSKTQPFPSTTKSCIYKNNLDLMLKEMNNSKKAKAFETQLLTACKEDLLRIAEYEEVEENLGEGISTEHQEFLQRYSLMSSAIREVPPGEVVFNLEKFGQIFNHDTLQLRQCMVNPQGRAQKTLLWSSPAQLRLHVNIGLFQEAYDCCSPCPTQVTRFLFKMMSVHNERLVSEKILQALCDIACTAAYQIVKHGSQQFKVWVPSLADVALVLMNMGAAFVTLFPFENLQPPFTEGDLLEDVYITSKSPSSNNEQRLFPEHNCNHILKYLSYCMDLCPRAYSDDELLLLLTVVGRVCLDTRLIPQSNVELYPLQYKIVSNIRDWDAMLPRICQALTDLTDDHHNMCLLVQLLPDNTRGKQLRRHLSLSMISKLLDGKCTYKPKEKEIQLSELRQYLPRMQPSFLRGMLSSIRSEKVEDMANLDQQSYYLCYSLLTLAKEASNFQFFPAHQKEQLLFLSSQLETHVKSDIRESEKCLYRSKLKDLVARIYTKWQMLLQKTRPLHGKLYDYWQPVETSINSKEKQEMDNSDDGEGSVMEDDGEEDETSGTEENEFVMAVEDKEEEEGDDGMDDRKETGDNTKPEEVEGDDTMGDAKETEEATELIHEELNQEMPETESQMQVESQVMDEAGHVERAEVETENVETRETSQHDQIAACALVS